MLDIFPDLFLTIRFTELGTYTQTSSYFLLVVIQGQEHLPFHFLRLNTNATSRKLGRPLSLSAPTWTVVDGLIKQVLVCAAEYMC